MTRGKHLPALAEKTHPTTFDLPTFEKLLRDPEKDVRGVFGGASYSARIAIPNYGARLARHFPDVAPNGITAASVQAEIPFNLVQFGLIVTFDKEAELPLHGDDMVLDDSARALVDRFGPVIFRNAYIFGEARNRFHRNIFPHLKFHVDRGPALPNQYSCFTRDPSDAEQRFPRASSTLFTANITAWLEVIRAGEADLKSERGVRSSYDLFIDADMAPLLGEIVLEQKWDAPVGTGEIVIADNRTVLHATYHKDGRTKGYKIGARYLI